MNAWFDMPLVPPIALCSYLREIWMRVIYKWVWHMKEWDIRISQSDKYIMSHIQTNTSSHTYEWHTYKRHTYDRFILHIWVMSHTRRSRVTHVKESCQTHGGVVSHICMSHITHMKVSCRTYESCHTDPSVMAHIRMRHITHMNESCRTCEGDMSVRIW